MIKDIEEQPFISDNSSSQSVDNSWLVNFKCELRLFVTNYAQYEKMKQVKEKLEQIFMQAINYQQEQFFLENLIEYIKVLSSEQQENILATLDILESDVNLFMETDLAFLYRESTHTITELKMNTDKVVDVYKKNPNLFEKNSELVHTLEKILDSLTPYQCLMKDKINIEESNRKILEDKNPSNILFNTQDYLQEISQILEETACTCSSCNHEVHMIPKSTYSRIMRRVYGFEEQDLEPLISETKDDVCPNCGADVEERFLISFIADIQTEEGEVIDVLDIGQAPLVKKWLNEATNVHVMNTYYSINSKTGELELKNPLVKERSKEFIFSKNGLQYVKDFDKFLDYIYYSLSDEGLAVITVPYFVKDESVKTNRVNTAERWNRTGNSKYFNVFSKGEFEERIRKHHFGFTIVDKEWYGNEYMKEFGYPDYAQLYILTKQE